MTRAALTKLLILLILAFIICLPEFFTLYRGGSPNTTSHGVSKVNFQCLPYQPCENQDNLHWDAQITRNKKKCDPPGGVKWEQDCTHESNSRSEDAQNNMFMCKADVNMEELQRNMLTSAVRSHLEVSVELHLLNQETLNLTLYGSSNHSSLHLHPQEEEQQEEQEEEQEEEEQEEEEEEDAAGRRRKAFYCCLSVSANQSRCLLWIANQTALRETAEETLPWKQPQTDEWQCVLWLSLLCVLMLTAVTAVFGKLCCSRHSYRSRAVSNVTGQRLNVGENHTEIISHKAGRIPLSKGHRRCSELATIQEVESQDDRETLLDGNADHCSSANLHHRVHFSSSSLTEEQTC